MIIKLGEVASFVNGYAFKPSDWSDNGMPIIRIQDLTGNSYKMNRYNGDIEQKYKVQDGDVLISWSASLGVYVWHGENAVLNQHIFKVVFDKIDVSKDYFVYQIEYRLGNAASEAHGATMKHLTKSVFNALPFYLPKKEEQEKIAKVLNKITELTNKTRKQAKLLDDIIKSRFIELFGDPVSNSRNWEMSELGSLTSIGSSKRIFEKEYVSEGIPFYRTMEIVELAKGNSISTELYITEARYNELKKQYGVPNEGDLLLSAVGTIGVIWIVDGKNDFYFKDGNLIRIDRSEKFNSIYMKNLLEFLICEYKKQMSSGTAYAALTISGLTKMKVYDVPKNLQNQFADFVAHVDKSKHFCEMEVAA